MEDKRCEMFKLKGNVLTLVVFLLFILLSFSVSADVLSVRETIDQFSGVFELTPELMAFLTWVAYLILFWALFYEGLYRIPVFGRMREVSKAGKAFAFAAASLSTLALWGSQLVTGKSATEIAQDAAAPFGVWGSFAIAAIVGLITYRMIKDSGFFKDSTLVPMAMAAAFAMAIVGLWVSWGTLFVYGVAIACITALVGLFSHFSGKSGSGTPAADVKDKEKDETKGEKKAKKEDKYVIREIAEIEQLRKHVEDAESLEDLEDVKHDMHAIERVERRMKKRFRRVEQAGEDLIELKPQNKSELEQDLNDLELFSNKIIAYLSRGGVLEKALLENFPSSWDAEHLPERGSVSDDEKNALEVRRNNVLQVIDKILKWDEAFHLHLEKYEKDLEKEKKRDEASE